MEIEFTCGEVKKNVGSIYMVLINHAKECENEECVKECEADAPKYKGHFL